MTGEIRVKENPLGPWLPLLEEYELSTVPGELILRGRLRHGMGPASPEVEAALGDWSGTAHLHGDEAGVELVLVLPEDEDEGRPWLHAVLLGCTILTTLAAGALMEGMDPFHTRVARLGGVLVPYPTGIDLATLRLGIPFALPFLGVLLAHEMGHYAAARRHRIRASLPYFIPFPPYFSIIGTMGAFIRLRGATIRRTQLFDVGASGPVVSFVLSLPLLAWGLSLSSSVSGPASLASPFVVEFAGQAVWLGNGPLVHLLAVAFGPEGLGRDPVLLHPVAFAGWLGLFVTALNLLPLGQLDGGHVLYALFGDVQARTARLFLLALLPLGLLWWGWWAWAALIWVLHRGRLRHPSVIQPQVRLRRRRRLLGWALIVIFFLTFVPVPLGI